MAYPQPTQGYQPGPPTYTPYAGQAGYAPQPPPQQYGYQPQPAGYGGQQQQANTNVVVVQQQATPRVSELLIVCSLILNLSLVCFDKLKKKNTIAPGPSHYKFVYPVLHASPM